MNSKGKIDPASAQVTAQALAQAGIITNPDGQIMTSDGQTISAAEILNFPEVVAALGLLLNYSKKMQCLKSFCPLSRVPIY